jgi:phosphoglycolate phosphatase
MAFRAVLFDLDGTLLDTIDDLTDSMNITLAAFGYPQHTVDECKYFVGDGVELYVRRALPQALRDDATIAKVAKAFRAEYLKRWADKTRPYEGITELTTRLRQRGLKLVVFSNKPQETTTLTVSKFLQGVQFDAVVGAREGVARKPDPSGALSIAAELGIAPREFIYVGDTNTDMQTAVSAGMYPVGALWGFRTAEELLANGARVLIRHPLDLLAVLDHADSRA